MPEAVIADEDDGIRVDRWFKRHVPDVSFNLASRWGRMGQLRLEGAKVGPGDRVAAGQRLVWPEVEPEVVASRPVQRERAPLSQAQIDYVRSMVIYKDANAIVINKPPGLATQGGTGTTTHVDGLLDGLMYELEVRPKLVHRLDKDTSGVLLLARTARAAAYFSKGFAGRDAKKFYWALTMGVPRIKAGTIEAALAKQPGTGGEKMHVDEAEGLPAKTRYRVIDAAGARAAWVEFQPLTGRTHQIRVHSAAMGHPLVGDGKYGGKESFLTGGVSRKLHLHARRLVVDAPGGGKIDVTAELPAHMAESFAMLGFDMARGEAVLEPVVPVVVGKPKPPRRISSATSGNRRGERRSRSR
jgi:23S rRNA pseudouridine955/2504/2580 synthase